MSNCTQCEALTINGVYCHETGCPEAWRDETRSCNWCGSPFTPEDRAQDCCDAECYAAYAGH